MSKKNRVQRRSANAEKETATKTLMALILLFLFNSDFVLISNFVFISSNLHTNKISQLPENVFSGLTGLRWL